MKVWITKYCLTQGILEKVVDDCGNGMVADRSSGFSEYYHVPFWHRSKELAINHAEELRLKKITSVKKQLKRLEKLHFVEGRK